MAASQSFASPISWLDRADLTLVVSSDNRATVTVLNNKSVTASAFYDGMLVWRPDSATKGNLELGLCPGLWPDKVRKRFNETVWTELPPGRVVYQGLEWNTVKSGLQRLIKAAWDTYEANPSRYRSDNDVYDPLGFIPGITPNEYGSFYFHLDRVKRSNPADLNKALLDEIGRALEAWRMFNPALPSRGIPVRSGRSLFTLTHSAGGASTVEIEFRNLYGEPLNPFYYLKRLSETGTPAWALAAGSADTSRIAIAGSPLIVRAPKQGGAEYRLLNQVLKPRQPLEDPYRSRLAWQYQTDANGVYGVTIKARFNNVQPASLRDMQVYVEASWNSLSAHINKYGLLFNVPGELMLALIHVESAKRPDRSPDPHSFRFEPVHRRIARDYVDLRKTLSTPGTNYTYTEHTLKAYAKIAGGAVAKTAADDGPLKETGSPKERARRFAVPAPYSDAARLGAKKPASDISWKQLSEIASIKTDLIAADEITLPSLGTYLDKKTRLYLYDLLSTNANVGATLTELYWRVAGGIRLQDNKEEISPAGQNPAKKVKPTLPFVADDVALTIEGANSGTITWGQLLTLLQVLQTKVKAPQVTFVLGKLRTARIDKNGAIAGALRAKYPGLPEAEIADLVTRYIAVQEKAIRYVEDPMDVNKSRLEDRNNNANYLTVAETRMLSKIYPGRMSFGVQQALFSTGIAIIRFLKARYGADFFSTEVGITNPPTGDDALIDWIWDQAWNSLEMQVVFLSGYLKSKAVTQWKKYSNKGLKRHYADGEPMNMYDLPRVAGAYNHGRVEAPVKDMPPQPGQTNNPENQTDWGFWYHGNYIGSGQGGGNGFAALQAAFTLLANPATTPTPLVRLVPELEANSGMEPL